MWYCYARALYDSDVEVQWWWGCLTVYQCSGVRHGGALV